MDTSTMSPADFAAMSGNEFGNNGIMCMFFLFLLIFGWGGFGGNQNTAMQQGFDMQNTLANQRELLAATNQSFHDTMGVINNAYGELQRDIAGLAVGQANLLAQENECCANTSMAIAQNRYDAALNTAAINANTTAQTQKVLDAIQQNKIESLQAQVSALELQNQLASVVRYPSNTFYAVPSPCFNTCGCGNI